jgi:hypothetical protein
MTRHLTLVFTNPSPGREEDYHAWYQRHLHEVLANHPGYMSAERFRRSDHQRATAIPCPWAYLALYEIETDDIAATQRAADAFKAAGGFTSHDGALAGDQAVWTYTEYGPKLHETAEASARKTALGSGRNVFLALTNPAEGREADFHLWYEAHVPEILDNYPGLTTGQLLRAASVQRAGSSLTWEYLAIYDLEADDTADYVANEPLGLKGMTSAQGALAAGPAQWVFSAVGPRVAKEAIASVAADA